MGERFMDNYVEVTERIQEFRKAHPDGTLQAEVVPTGIEGFVAVRAFAYRSADDPRPGIGLAWEPVPGKTNFTKDSELQNAETSAWGRAIVAVGAADTKRGIASANEVRSRPTAPITAPQPASAEPQPSLMEETFVCIEPDPEGRGRKCVRTSPHSRGHSWGETA